MTAILFMALCVFTMSILFVGAIVCIAVFADRIIDILQGGYDNDDE